MVSGEAGSTVEHIAPEGRVSYENRVHVVRALACAILVCIFPLVGILAARGPQDGGDDDGIGLWGKKTASVNWCEADYAVTSYVAEFGNTVSSLGIIAQGFYGLYMHCSVVEPRFTVAFVFFMIVGVGSVAFHCTLWRSMQLLDELPMIWGNAAFIYIIVAMEDEANEDRRAVISAIVVTTVLMSLAIFTLDKVSQDVFLLCYGSEVIFLFGRSSMLNFQYNSRSCVLLLEASLIFYGGAFVLWLLDRNFCSTVRSLYLHSFWHFGAGLGTFTAILFWIWVRQEFLRLRPVVRGLLPMTRWIEPSEKNT